MITRLVIFLALLAAPCALKAADRPNLVFILADDLGWSDTTLLGTTTFYETPNITRLAKRGMLFTNAYTAHPLCSPSRSSIMSGLDLARTGFTSAAGHLADANLEKKLPEQAKPNQKVLTPRSVSRLDTRYVTLAESIYEGGTQVPCAVVWPGKTKPDRKSPDPNRLVKRRDTNNDGFVTLNEYTGDPKNRNVPALTRQFNQKDANKDQRLTVEEMKSGN